MDLLITNKVIFIGDPLINNQMLLLFEIIHRWACLPTHIHVGMYPRIPALSGLSRSRCAPIGIVQHGYSLTKPTGRYVRLRE